MLDRWCDDFQIVGRANVLVNRFQLLINVELVGMSILGNDSHRLGREQQRHFVKIESLLPGVKKDLFHVARLELLEGASSGGGGLHGNRRLDSWVRGHSQEGLYPSARVPREANSCGIHFLTLCQEAYRRYTIMGKEMRELFSDQQGDRAKMLMLTA